MAKPVEPGEAAYREVPLAPEGTRYRQGGVDCVQRQWGPTGRLLRCLDKEDVAGVLFEGNSFLRAPPAPPRIQFYSDYPITHGLLRYRNQLYSVKEGFIYDETAQVGRIEASGNFLIELADRTMSGNVHDFFGMAARLYLGEREIFDSFPATGSMYFGGAHYRVSDSLIYSGSETSPEQGLGSINGRGEIIWNDGDHTRAASSHDGEAFLVDDNGNDQYHLLRLSGETEQATVQIHAPQTLSASGLRDHVQWNRFKVVIFEDRIEVRVSIKLLFPKGKQPARNEQVVWEQKLNAYLNSRFGRSLWFTTTTGRRYELRFVTNFVERHADGQVQVYMDDQPSCTREFDRRCRTIQPALNQLSWEDLFGVWPHEFWHSLGLYDESPDLANPQRPPCDPASIMCSYRGGLKADHLTGLKLVVEELLGHRFLIERRP